MRSSHRTFYLKVADEGLADSTNVESLFIKTGDVFFDYLIVLVGDI